MLYAGGEGKGETAFLYGNPQHTGGDDSFVDIRRVAARHARHRASIVTPDTDFSAEESADEFYFSAQAQVD